jgi:hypothetical protein
MVGQRDQGANGCSSGRVNPPEGAARASVEMKICPKNEQTMLAEEVFALGI